MLENPAADARRALLPGGAAELRREPAEVTTTSGRHWCSATSAARAARSRTASCAREVARIAAGLAAAGVVAGDRVAGFLPNLPETTIAMLATASLGAIWSSCSPDFGVHGVLDRFGQIAPKVLFTADGYFYAGKKLDSLEPMAAVLAQLDSIERVVVIPYVEAQPRARARSAPPRRAPRLWQDFGARGRRSSLRGRCPSITRSTSSIPPAPPACPSASCTAPAARCCSTRRSTCCTPTSSAATGCSTSPPAAG